MRFQLGQARLLLARRFLAGGLALHAFLACRFLCDSLLSRGLALGGVAAGGFLSFGFQLRQAGLLLACGLGACGFLARLLGQAGLFLLLCYAALRLLLGQGLACGLLAFGFGLCRLLGLPALFLARRFELGLTGFFQSQCIQARCFDACGLRLLLPDLLQPLRLALGVFLLD